jgi:3',5'-cyclic AMP phosphodiesterase CpdA
MRFPRSVVVAVALFALVGIVAAFAFLDDGRASRSTRGPSEPSEQPVPTPTGPFRFVVLGDFGNGSQAELKVAGAIDDWTDAHPVNALVTTGDNVYESGSPTRFAEAWEGPFGWVSVEGIPVVATLGNHDVETQGGAPVMGLLDMPSRWYTRRIGPVEFIVLDANRPTDPRQLDFLRRAVATSTARWKIAVFHQPAYSCSRHGSTPEVDDLWLPLLAGDGVDLVLNGHDHAYQRFGPIDGTTYVVTGGGGAPLYHEDDCPDGTPEPEAKRVVHHFVTLVVSGSRLRIEALDSRLRSIDEVDLVETKNG